MGHHAKNALGLPQVQNGGFARILDFLGGEKWFGSPVRSQLEAHQLIADGFPGGVLTLVAKKVKVLGDPEVLQKAVGASGRTTQRKAAAEKSLTEAQSGRLWKFAEIMTRASELFGGEEAAGAWLVEPAMALDQRRPVDLLSNPAGVALVEDVLTRLEYGVYA